MENKKSSWDLFNDMFKVGDEVIIITDDDRYEWGVLQAILDDGAVIKRPEKKAIYWEWEKVCFMCHDGFPVRKLQPSSSDLYVEKLLEGEESKTLQVVVRKALMSRRCSECSKPVECSSVIPMNEGEPCMECRPRRSFTGGHPWQIEGVHCELYNPGNYTFPFWSNAEFEETIVMKDPKTGLIGQLWDLPSIFEVEGFVV